MEIREIDELGNIKSKIDSFENLLSVPYSQYFGEMSISDDEKEKREELSPT